MKQHTPPFSIIYNDPARDFKGDVSQLNWKLRFLRRSLQIIDRVSPQLSTHLLVSHFIHPRHKKGVQYEHHLPQGGRRIEIFHNLTKLTGWAWGEEGPAVLLVHGWESHVGRMLPLVEPLLEQGCRVVAFDAPGHGLSPRVSTNLIDAGYAVQNVIEQYGPFHSIIAHSFGAAATAVVLAREPHLMPRKLVLLSPMRDLEQQLDIFAEVARLSPNQKTRLKAQIARRVGWPFSQCSTIEAVRSFEVPGLVVHDRQDRLIPHDVGITIAQQWRGAGFISTDHLGHRLGLSNAEVIHQILSFLETDQPYEVFVRLSYTKDLATAV